MRRSPSGVLPSLPVQDGQPPLLSTADPALLRAVSRLYFDVDDTLTWRAKLPEETLSALYRAHEKGISLVAVTGRSAAWAEMMMRIFPFDAAVAETGALCFVKAPGGGLDILHSEPDEAQREVNRGRREAAARRVLAEVPTARLALDNLGRLYDTAFDLVEDGPPVPASDAEKIRAILAEEGLTTAQSSVHVNAWIGRFDKATMVARYLEEHEHTTLEEAAPRLVYVGDSRNDGPMFKRTALSVGVGNVAPHLDELRARSEAPAFLVEDHGGHGFAEVVRLLIKGR